MALVFELRQTLPKKYNVAMCHGSRLICDMDVYDKKFKLIQVLEHPELPKINSICSFDREYLLIGTVCYFICLLRWDPETNVYHYVRRFRLEKSNNGEGDFTLIERIAHLEGWIVACTLRALRIFRLEDTALCYEGRQQKKAIKDLKCIRFAISK